MCFKLYSASLSVFNVVQALQHGTVTGVNCTSFRHIQCAFRACALFIYVRLKCLSEPVLDAIAFHGIENSAACFRAVSDFLYFFEYLAALNIARDGLGVLKTYWRAGWHWPPAGKPPNFEHRKS